MKGNEDDYFNIVWDEIKNVDLTTDYYTNIVDVKFPILIF